MQKGVPTSTARSGAGGEGEAKNCLAVREVTTSEGPAAPLRGEWGREVAPSPLGRDSL